MQRYYHKGAFTPQNLTAEQQAVLERDFNLPTGEDKMDKSALPSVLQKRTGQFGRKGQSKYTHLTDQDTTNFNPVQKVSEQLAYKLQLKQGGFKGMNQLDRPSAKRRRF